MIASPEKQTILDQRWPTSAHAGWRAWLTATEALARGMLGVLDLACGSALDVDVVLERVLEAACELTGARYAALGILDRSRSKLERVITAGLDEPTHRQIDAVYLTEKPQGEEFSEEDEQTVGLPANIGVHGAPTTLHLEELWIKNITITTGPVSGSTIPTLMQLVRHGRIEPEKLGTHYQARGDHARLRHLHRRRRKRCAESRPDELTRSPASCGKSRERRPGLPEVTSRGGAAGIWGTAVGEIVGRVRDRVGRGHSAAGWLTAAVMRTPAVAVDAIVWCAVCDLREV